MQGLIRLKTRQQGAVPEPDSFQLRPCRCCFSPSSQLQSKAGQVASAAHQQWGQRPFPTPALGPDSWELCPHHHCFSQSQLPSSSVGAASSWWGAVTRPGICKLQQHCPNFSPPSHLQHGCNFQPGTSCTGAGKLPAVLALKPRAEG